MQRILTPSPGRILRTLNDEVNKGNTIVAVSPLYAYTARGQATYAVTGYIVVVEEPISQAAQDIASIHPDVRDND